MCHLKKVLAMAIRQEIIFTPRCLAVVWIDCNVLPIKQNNEEFKTGFENHSEN